MTTKKTVVPAEQAEQPQAHAITLTDSSHKVWPAMAHLVRQGYIVHPDIFPEVFAAQGQTSVTLIRGNPDAQAVELATQNEAVALVRQQARWERDVAVAAAQMLEDARQAEAKATLAAAVVEQEKALRALKDKLARAA